jgi:hypothetical protein
MYELHGMYVDVNIHDYGCENLKAYKSVNINETQNQHRDVLFFCNPILFAVCTSTFSKVCKKTYTVACRRVLSSTPQ